MVRGDDYVTTGGRAQLAWFEAELKKRFEIKVQKILPVLNRVDRWTREGWQVEADQRHSEIMLEQLNLQQAKSLSVPGSDEDDKATEADLVPLEGADATLFRGLAARSNYLAPDRPDIMYPAKEICREMAKPCAGSLKTLHRVGRYLKGKPRLVWFYNYQGWPQHLHIFADSNWVACKRTRKSTSGGLRLLWPAHPKMLEQNAEPHSAQLWRGGTVWYCQRFLRSPGLQDYVQRPRP